MIRPICHDVFLLRQKASAATEEDLKTAQDLYDTLSANRDRCVGMAANMIGVPKAIIAIAPAGIVTVMLNPVLEKRTGKAYDTEEGCLSLTGTRPCRRYPSVTVSYQDRNLLPHRETYTGFAAQIVQHEMDHLAGILI